MQNNVTTLVNKRSTPTISCNKSAAIYFSIKKAKRIAPEYNNDLDIETDSLLLFMDFQPCNLTDFQTPNMVSKNIASNAMYIIGFAGAIIAPSAIVIANVWDFTIFYFL